MDISIKNIILAVSLLVVPALVSAQSGGSAIMPTETPVSVTTAPIPAVAAPRTTITITPTPSAITTPSTPVSISPTPTPRVTPASVPSEENNNLFYILAASAPVLAGFVFAVYKAKTKVKNSEDNRCDSIKGLHEKKNDELEDSIRNWPEEKLKSMAKDKVLGEIKKDEDAKKIIEMAESLKAKHEKLKETIELLQKRYDLCMLSLPSVEGAHYKGTIIENSLKDRGILKNLEITKNYQVEDWVLNDVLVNEKQIEKLGEHLNDGPWYMHFWQEGKDDVIVVFKEKNFKIKYSDKSTWKDAIEYGKSKGIPEEHLDFLK